MTSKTGWSDSRPPSQDIDLFVQYHIVKRGETLVSIAEAYYGDARFNAAIFDANRDILAGHEELLPGQKLRIP
ncbi:MAG: LysM peptidoglycan-binding domain-containing protein [Gammaproteobacteria bacterium]